MLSRSLVPLFLARRNAANLLVAVVVLICPLFVAAQSSLLSGNQQSASGVVLGSFGQRANADGQLQRLQQTMGDNDIRLQVIAGEGPRGPIYRVVAQSTSLNSRSLLQRLRANGFADAWHVTDPVLARVPAVTPGSQSEGVVPMALGTGVSASDLREQPTSQALQVIASTEVTDCVKLKTRCGRLIWRCGRLSVS